MGKAKESDPKSNAICLCGYALYCTPTAISSVCIILINTFPETKKNYISLMQCAV